MKVLEKVAHLAFICLLIGPISFVFGQSLPRKWFDYRAFPFRPFAFEKSGRIYFFLKVHRWKDKAPDMSKIVNGVFRKKLGVKRDEGLTLNLIRETCVAEFVHLLLILASPVFLIRIGGWQGWAAMISYATFNLPFIAIQRYNRPRLVEIMEREAVRNSSKGQ